MGDDNRKRLFWPLARITELIPGRDGKIRTVKLKTRHGTVIRPIQRIFPLEIQANDRNIIPDKKLGAEESNSSAGCEHVVKLMSQQSWLLRILAVELRVTSAHHQRSHVHRLLSSLLDDKPPVESGAVDVTEPSFGSTSRSSYSFMKPTTGTFRRKFMKILDSIQFHHKMPDVPRWDYFENEEVERILKECEIREPDGPRLIDVEELHNRLAEETMGLQGASVIGQRTIMMQEISKVLEYAVSCNEAREAVFAKRLLFDAWRQVTEVLLIACPLEMLGNEKKDQMVLELSQELLSKYFLPGISKYQNDVGHVTIVTPLHSTYTVLPDPASAFILPQAPSMATDTDTTASDDYDSRIKNMQIAFYSQLTWNLVIKLMRWNTVK
ncbi:nuclear pore complex protein Nup205-like [Stegodyphus dumicola]|uniref:nuclear pore complex protein Nup205-like n=1 Tax=Stegodyphus dumicola TaxID=202533 RepID=UPI0015B18EE0|nr:nuclear pore complex protein Nup205-like [Stegodyphus dumicola]